MMERQRLQLSTVRLTFASLSRNINAFHPKFVTTVVSIGSSYSYVYGSNVFQAYQWIHVISTMSGSTMTLYGNGVFVSSTPSTYVPTTTTRTNNYIGRPQQYYSTSYGVFTGIVAYLRVWNGYVLRAAEASELYSLLYCAAGSYVSGSSCIVCASGTYSSASMSSSCASCATGRYSVIGSTSCMAPTHEWDFRSCTTGSSVTDTYAMSMAATPIGSPSCSAAGVKFSSASQWMVLPSWSWGGASSFETYVSFFVLNADSRIFDLGTGTDFGDGNLFMSSFGSSAPYKSAATFCK